MRGAISTALVVFSAALAALVLVVILSVDSMAKSAPTLSLPKPNYVEGMHYKSRRMTNTDRLLVLENELLDPNRNPDFEQELQEEIARVRRSIERTVVASCGCN